MKQTQSTQNIVPPEYFASARKERIMEGIEHRASSIADSLMMDCTAEVNDETWTLSELFEKFDLSEDQALYIDHAINLYNFDNAAQIAAQRIVVPILAKVSRMAAEWEAE